MPEDMVMTVVSVDSLERDRRLWDESKKNTRSDSSVIPYYVTGEKVKRHYIGFVGRPSTLKMPMSEAA